MGTRSARHLVAGLPARASPAPSGGAAAGAAPSRGCASSQAWLDHLVGLGCNGLALGPVFDLGDPRLRHHRPPRRRPAAGRPSDDLDSPGRRPATRAASGCCSTASSTTSAAASRGSGRCSSRAPALAGRPPGSTSTPTEPARRVRLPRLRGPRRPGRAQPRQARGRRLRRPRDDLLVRPRRRRLAAGRGLRRAPGVLARGAAAGARTAPGRLGRRRGDPRRLRRLRRRVGHRLGHPVRAVEGDLELAERPQPLRAGPRAAPARRAWCAASCRRPSSATTTSPGSPAGSTDERHLPLALALLFCCPACRASTTATSSACAG